MNEQRERMSDLNDLLSSDEDDHTKLMILKYRYETLKNQFDNEKAEADKFFDWINDRDPDLVGLYMDKGR